MRSHNRISVGLASCSSSKVKGSEMDDAAIIPLAQAPSAPDPVPLAQPTPSIPSSTSTTAGMKSKPSTPRPSDLSSAVQRSPDSGRALNVTDALSYLDAVKVQFAEKPEVYNRFLDIMKDFKSQVIDTPGVIQRVSRLFHGNPLLIQGFNTFLPVGYRIDVSADPMDPNTITVTTPSGTMTQNTTIPRSHANTPTFPAGIPPPQNHPHAPGSRSHTPHALHPHGPPPMYDSIFSPGFQNPQTTAAANVLGNMGNTKDPVGVQPAGEFNHAIHYLNKIKARYADDPNTYKQFLDILQTYQKEQKHLQDSQVYAQVQVLFKDAPDILTEFKDFLPQAVPGHSSELAHPQPLSTASASASWNQPDAPSSVDKGSKRATASSTLKRKKRFVEKEVTPVPPAKVPPSRAGKKIKHHHTTDNTSAAFSPIVQPESPEPSHQKLPQPLQLHSASLAVTSLGNTSADRLLFFDRAKKLLENREMYEDFLKLLDLFSREIIGSKALVDQTSVLLGDSDLLTEFKDLIGWDEALDNPEKGPPGSIRTGPPEALSALPADDGEGPSYRRLPESEVHLACSGRDELCRSVLNDEWVSHPTWASEEAGFIPHKKNSFEDALHKSEEERFEYQVQLEALARTITVLEPINTRIEEMNTEERTLFKLKSNFGGPSKAIYHRIIKKVYGRDGGAEVIQALQDCPSVAVPVVLSRLKQKDQEWRHAQREWSRTWREVDSKNFYKSLDHQGIVFKANDKKNITAKHFIADIESIKAKQVEAREQNGTNSPTFARGSVGHQLEYAFHDTSTLLDSLKMIYSFLDRSQAQYSSQERRSVEKFLRVFIPLLCMYPVAEFNAACGPLEGAHDDDSVELNGYPEGGHRSGRRSAGSTHSVHSTGVVAHDLRRRLLRTAQEKNAGKSTPGVSRDTSPSPQNCSPSMRTEDLADSPHDIWITEAGTDTLGQKLSEVVTERPFFANTTFYTLLRLLQLLYSRLLMCKEVGAQHAAEKHVTLLANQVAVELGLDEPNGPSAVLEQTIEVLGDRGAGENANVVYMYLLNACEKLFDSEMDQATFEEHMRWFFGNKAYQLFTLDKLITALVKQVQTILSDHRCQELWKLLQIAQNSEVITTQDVVRYRREAERHLGQDEHLYRLHWVRDLKCIRVHLVEPDDSSMDTDRTALRRWRGYVDSYVLRSPTEWLPVTKAGGAPVFMRRHLQGPDGPTSTREEGELLKVRVSVPSYKLVYEQGSEDMVWRVRGRREEERLRTQAVARAEKRRKCVYLV